ncbi:alkaline phosphatase family protein [Mycoplasma todarodis]|uniref:alkaline phosphatase family protein n=1 Tax=Mycoplasma todarodis TaxID=1937191 RepID=UPI003B38D3D9
MKFKLGKKIFATSLLSLSPVIAMTAVACGNNLHTQKKDSKTRVIWIGVDGFSANVWKKHPTPNISKLLTNSNYSMDAQDIMPSKTYPNWSALFTSMKPDKTGIEGNPGSIFQSKLIKKPTKWNNNGKGVAFSIFDAIKEQTTLRSKFIYPLTKDFNIKNIVNKDAVELYFAGESDNTDPKARDQLKRELENKGNISSSSRIGYILSGLTDVNSIHEATKTLTSQSSEFIFSYITGLDIRGHAFGWGSNEYISYMNQIDVYIGELMKEIRGYDNFENTIFVLTADHGGVLNDKKHGGNTPDERTVPIIIHNRNQKEANNLGNISNLDVTPTLAKTLGLKQYKDWEGTILNLK